MSSFRGNDIFGSGPHRFSLGKQGIETVPNSFLFDVIELSGSFQRGPEELRVIVTGRLVAASVAALWLLRDAVAAEADPSLGAATLDDGAGRTWPGLWLVDFSEEDRVDRGRVVSIGYAAEFRRLTEI